MATPIVAADIFPRFLRMSPAVWKKPGSGYIHPYASTPSHEE